MAADGSQYPQPPPQQQHQLPLNRIPSSPHYTSHRQAPSQNVARSTSQQQVIGRAARQSYARQKLPMRVQSLASYANNSSVGRLPQQGMSYQRSSVTSYGIPNSPPPRYELISRPQIPTLSAPPPPRHSSYGAAAPATASSSVPTSSSSAQYTAAPHVGSSPSIKDRLDAKPLPPAHGHRPSANQQPVVNTQSPIINTQPLNPPVVNLQSAVNSSPSQANLPSASTQPLPPTTQQPIVNSQPPQVNQAALNHQPQVTLPEIPVHVQHVSPTSKHSRLPARTSSIPMRQDEEDFNFRGRPSSTLIQVQPAPDDAYSPDGDEVSFADHQPEFAAVAHGFSALEKPLPKVSKSDSTARADRHIEMEVEKLAIGLQGKVFKGVFFLQAFYLFIIISFNYFDVITILIFYPFIGNRQRETTCTYTVFVSGHKSTEQE